MKYLEDYFKIVQCLRAILLTTLVIWWFDIFPENVLWTSFI